jgi:hypothetical protein
VSRCAPLLDRITVSILSTRPAGSHPVVRRGSPSSCTAATVPRHPGVGSDARSSTPRVRSVTMPRQSRPGSAPDRASRASSQGGSDRVTLFDALTCRAAGRYTPGSTIRYSSPWLRPSGLSHPSGSAVLLAPLPLEAFDQLEASATDGFLAQIPLTLIEAGKRAGSVAWIAVEDPSHPWPELPGKDNSAGPCLFDLAVSGTVSGVERAMAVRP